MILVLEKRARIRLSIIVAFAKLAAQEFVLIAGSLGLLLT